MAKKSAIKKNETRIKKVSLMGKKRKALKDIIMNRELPLDDLGIGDLLCKGLLLFSVFLTIGE